MDAKLKSLKVTDLKDILTKAGVATTSKANKADLIAKIIASPSAVEVFNNLHSATVKPSPAQTDDLLAPPEDVDWDDPEAKPAEPQVPVPVAVKPIPKEVPSAPTAVATTASEPVDPELEKRKARAARFGITLVEPKPAKSAAVSDEKLQQRAARFGIANNTKPQKRSAPTDEVNPEEAERRRKRAERFGTAPATS